VTKWVAHPKDARWPRSFIPTSSSWMNLVDGWFSQLTKCRLKRGAFSCVDDLVTAIEACTEHWNDDPKPLALATTRRRNRRQDTTRQGLIGFHKSATHH
jgi:hypothetical protein